MSDKSTTSSGGMSSSSSTREPDRTVAGAGGTSSSTFREPEPVAADPPAAENAPGIMMTVGEYVTALLNFADDYPALGVMEAPAAGTVSESEPNIVKSSVSFGGSPAQAILRLDALNVGKTVVHYRLDDVAVAIPVEVVRRVPKAVSIDPNGITRARLP